MKVEPSPSCRVTNPLFIENHYLHRAPTTSHGFLLYEGESVVGAVSFGVPASHSLQKSLCPSNPKLVIELNRLWVDDCMPKNTESWFVSRAMKMIPPLLVVSYADTSQGHEGYIYRALNFHYSGRTDDTRKLYDYVIPGSIGHSRGVKWGTPGAVKMERSPKNKYWKATGNRTEVRHLESLCAWPKLSWKESCLVR